MYGLSKTMLIVWQCFLIAPVTRRNDDSNKYAFNTRWYALNLIVFGVLLTGVVLAVADELYASKSGLSLRVQNISSGVVIVLQVFLLTVVCALAVTCSASRYHTLCDIGRQLRHVDAVLGASAGHPGMQFAFYLVGLHGILYTVDGCLWYSISPNSWMYFVSYVYLFIDLAAMLMYAQIAGNIGHRFQDVNDEIERKLVGFQKTFGGTLAAGYGRPVQRARKCAKSTVAVSTVLASDVYYDMSEFTLGSFFFQKFVVKNVGTQF